MRFVLGGMPYRYLLAAVSFIPLLVIFPALTTHASSFFLSLLGLPNVVSGEFIHLNSVSLELVFECMVFPAYFLLGFLVLSVRKVPPRTRLAMWGLGASVIFLANVSRIAFVGFVLDQGNYLLFEETHVFIWRFLSWLFVAFVWIALVQLFKVESVPVLGDYRFLKEKLKK